MLQFHLPVLWTLKISGRSLSVSQLASFMKFFNAKWESLVPTKTFPDILLVISTERPAYQPAPPRLLVFMLNSLWCFKRGVCIQMSGERKDKAKSFQFYSINTLLNELFSRNLLQPSWRLSALLDFSTPFCVKYTQVMDQNTFFLY